jgi:mercuric ion binding protein
MLYGVIAGIAGLSVAGALAMGGMCTPEMMNDPAMRERMESHLPMMRGMGGMGMPMGGMAAEPSADAVPAEATQVATIEVEGMTCGGCAIGVRTALKRLDGVAKAEVSYEEQRAVVTFDPAKVGTDQLLGAVRKFGYKATLVEVKDRA